MPEMHRTGRHRAEHPPAATEPLPLEVIWVNGSRNCPDRLRDLMHQQGESIRAWALNEVTHRPGGAIWRRIGALAVVLGPSERAIVEWLARYPAALGGGPRCLHGRIKGPCRTKTRMGRPLR